MESEVPAELRRLGRHELLLPLASGGMASVYLARRTAAAGFERLVAIKVCHPHLRLEPDFVAMFVDEARLAARLHHPKVVPVLDIVETPVLHLVMEYVRGGSLAALTASCARAPGGSRPMMLRVIADMLEGLHAAHTARDDMGDPLEIVHRDVSPHNVLVGLDGIARLTDFGVARARERIASTRPGDVKGKLGYLAPEVLLENRVGIESDIFACGVLLWEVCTLQRLFPSDSAATSVAGALDSVRSLSDVVPDISPALDAVARRALARDPQQRFASAEALLDAIEASGERIASHREVSAWVERHLGPSLEQRESALRDARLDASSPPATSGVVASAPSPMSAPSTSAPSPAVNAVVTRRPRRNVALVALLVTLMATAGIAVVWNASDVPSDTPAERPTPPLPERTAVELPSPEPPAAPEPHEVTPPLEPAEVAPPASMRRVRRRTNTTSMRYRPESI